MPAYYENHLVLSYYCADLDQIPRLGREEETLLVERLRFAREHALPSQLVTATKHRLVEGNQRLVLFLALNLALLEATERCSFLHGTFSGYASVVIRSAFSKARAQDWPISITRDILQSLYQRDAIRNDALLHAYSLDAPLRGNVDLTLADILTTSFSPSPTSHDNPEKTTLVEGLLAGLTERQRQVVRLRYGLDEADQREYSLAEIAARLDMAESGVSETLKKALAACRRLAARRDQPQPPAAPHSYQPPRNEHMARKRLAQFATLREAEQTVRERGERITGKRLAKLAHVDSRVAHEYVRTHPDPDYEAGVQARERQRLEDACAQLEAQGQAVTLNRLVRLTSVALKNASAFLDAKAGDAQERLAHAYALLQGQGLKTIGRKRLAQAAQVSQHRAELFLRQQATRASSSLTAQE